MLVPFPNVTAEQLRDECELDHGTFGFNAEIELVFFQFVADGLNKSIDSLNEKLRWLGVLAPNEGQKLLTKEQFVALAQAMKDSHGRL